MQLSVRRSLLCFCLTALAAFAEQPGGTVLGITGKWSDANGPLHFGSQVAGDTLKCSEASTIMVSAPEGRVFARCDRSGMLRLSEQPRQAEPKGFLERLAAAARPFARRSQDGLIAAVSRDFGRDVREAVVPLAGAQVDVAPAMRDALPGSYQLQIAPLAGGTPSPPIAVHWEPGKALPLPATAISPGLYKLAVLDDSGRIGSDAWILVCGPADYAKTAAEFQQAIDAASKWSNDLDTAAMRPLLRAYLESLARGAGQ